MSVSFWYNYCSKYQASRNLDVRVDVGRLSKSWPGGVEGKEHSRKRVTPEMSGWGISKGIRGSQCSEEVALKTPI